MSSILNKQYETDPALEKKGVWYMIDGEEGEGSVGFLLARAGGANTAYTKAMEAEARPIRRKLQNDMIGQRDLRKLNIKVFAQTVVLDWKTVDSEGNTTPEIDVNGDKLVHSEENVVKAFNALPDLFDEIQDVAGKAAAYRKTLREQDSGN